MTNLETLKTCLFEVFSKPIENRVIIDTCLPLLNGDECNDTLYYMIDLSDGQEIVYGKFHVSASDGTGLDMTASEVVDFFASFIESDIIQKVYVESY